MTRRGFKRRIALALALTLATYLLVAYALLPRLWENRDRNEPVPAGEMVTRTSDGQAGDPINIGFAGSAAAMIGAFAAAGWRPADPITFDTSLGIVGSVLFDRPDPDAPVSPLLYEGRREDFAFEKEAGASADRRQHVRLWRDDSQNGLFLGAVSFDAGVGLSHYTGAVTHRISPDIDTARETLVRDMEETGRVARSYAIEGVGATQDGRNGEGDPYRTDGRATILVLNPA